MMQEPEIFDAESLRKARAELEAEVKYREAAMNLEFHKAVSQTKLLQILLNGFKGTFENETSETSNAESLRMLISTAFRAFMGRYVKSGVVQSIIPLIIAKIFTRKKASLFDKIKSRFFGKK